MMRPPYFRRSFLSLSTLLRDIIVNRQLSKIRQRYPAARKILTDKQREGESMKRGGVWCYIFTYFYLDESATRQFFHAVGCGLAVGAWWGEPVLGAKKEREKEESSLV
jgi:hypothetical protein